MYDSFLSNAQSDFFRAFKILSLNGQVFYNMSSYVVAAHAIDRMLAFSARHSIAPVVEFFPMSQVNDALEHLRSGKARFRIVLVNDSVKSASTAAHRQQEEEPQRALSAAV